MMSETADPWAEITPPAESASVSSRRASFGKWNLFWALDVAGHCLLLLRCGAEIGARERLPRIRGLEVERRTSGRSSTCWLVLRLMDREQRSLFHRLCVDIIGVTEKAETEEAAAAAFLGRTWRWHRLLTRGRDGRLSDQEQKALLAEITVLKRHLFPRIGAPAAVRAWQGPLGAPKDFEIGAVCVEAKARRGASAPHVEVSSPHQLDTDGIEALFLYVLDVAVVLDEATPGETITEAVSAVLHEIARQDHRTLALFEDRLSAAGFDPDDDYTDRRWARGKERLYAVRPEFPRIVPSMIPEGLDRVRYRLSLPALEPFRLDPATLQTHLPEGHDADHD